MIEEKHIKVATPPQFARLLGVTTTSVYRWINGSESNTGVLKTASERLGWSFDELCKAFEEWVAEERRKKFLQKEIDVYLNSVDYTLQKSA